jgi:hypothetical protein
MIPQRAATATKVAPATCELELQLCAGCRLFRWSPRRPGGALKVRGFRQLAGVAVAHPGPVNKRYDQGGREPTEEANPLVATD